MILVLAIAGSSFAQSADSIQAATLLRNEGKFDEALALISAYEVTHPDNINTIRLHGQLLYWLKDYEKADEYLQNAITNHPNNHLIKLDLASILYELGQLNRAQRLFEEILEKDPTNIDALMILGTIEYWHYNYRKGLAYFEKIIQIDSSNAAALHIILDIKKIIGPEFYFSAAYFKDNQPLDKMNSTIKYSWYRSPIIGPAISVDMVRHLRHPSLTSSLWLQLENRSFFQKANINSSISLGGFKHPAKKDMRVTGKLALKKTLFKHLIIGAEGVHSPYLYTLPSLETPIFTDGYSVSVSYNRSERWNSKAGYNLQIFPDDNSSVNIFGWLLAPPLKLASAQLRFGYGFSFTDTEKDRFILDNEASDTTIGPTSNFNIVGAYDPYYTPQNNYVHSLLTTLQLKLAKSVTLKVNANIGVYATIDQPYIFSPVIVSGKAVIIKDYYINQYNPYTILSTLSIDLTQKAVLIASHSYEKTAFYSSNNIEIGLKRKFFNAQQ